MLRVITVGLTLALLACSACSHHVTASATTDSPAASAADVGAVSALLAAHRAQQIERLEAYAAAGEFPHNYAKPTAAHVFRDEAGRLCAVANLVHQDGRDDLVDATAREHNDLAVADVADGAVFEWLLSSGLTQEELVRVQLPAPSLARRPAPQPKPTLPSPGLIAKNAADEELRMKAAVRLHVENVARELRDNTEASLKVAAERFIAHRDRTGSVHAALASN